MTNATFGQFHKFFPNEHLLKIVEKINGNFFVWISNMLKRKKMYVSSVVVRGC